MHAQGDGQFNIRGAAWTGDKDQIVTVFCFCKDLVHICTQHFGTDDGKMNAWKQGNGTRFSCRGLQYQRSRFGQKIIRFGDAQVTGCHFVFIGIRGNKSTPRELRISAIPNCLRRGVSHTVALRIFCSWIRAFSSESISDGNRFLSNPRKLLDLTQKGCISVSNRFGLARASWIPGRGLRGEFERCAPKNGERFR